jgi:hypothetical protein
MMSYVIVESMVNPNILKVGEGHNLPHVTIIDKGRVYLRLFLLHKKKSFKT